MKYADIQKIREAGIISAEQESQIVAHFKLKEDGGRFLAIISVVGATLVALGFVLLVAANWNEIPRGLKLAAGLALMLGAHGAGWWLREKRDYRKSSEALHLAGSGLFLANIALVGQIYNLSSRPPNAFLLWWAGIAALPWLLRSKAQHALALFAFGLWFGFEINQPGSWIFFGQDSFQLLLFALLGMIYLGGGYVLRRTSFHEFASVTEKLGLLGTQLALFPLTWDVLYRQSWQNAPISPWVFPVMALAALAALIVGLPALSAATPQFRWTWGFALAGLIGLMAAALYLAPQTGTAYDKSIHLFPWLFAVGLFVFCLVEIQIGLQERSESMVNLGIVFIALDMIAAYLNLFGSMATTGLMFVISGVLLIVFGIYLENKRRSLVRGLKVLPVSPRLVTPEN